MHQLRKPHWTERLHKSPYFLGAFIFHLVMGSFLAVYVVIPAAPNRESDPFAVIIPPLSSLPSLPSEELTSPENSSGKVQESGSPVTVPIPSTPSGILQSLNTIESMKPKVSSELLNLANEALIDKAPPFVFLSGSQDFRLTEKEVLNLQNYLQVGGAIWADNGLAGSDSRFDIAFRREMKRVIGELEFEELPLEHPLFQGPKTLFLRFFECNDAI